MKILLINNYHYLKGGSEKIYFNMGKLLKEKGHNVIYFSVADKDITPSYLKNFFVKPVDFDKMSFLKKIIHARKFIYSTEAKKCLERLIKETKPDIAHLHIFYGRLTSSILSVLKKFKIPTVMTVHEYRMLCPAYKMLTPGGNLCEKCAKGNYVHCIFNRCKNHKFFESLGIACECFFRDMFFPYHKFIDKFIMVSEFIMQKHIFYKPQLKDRVVQIYNFLNIDEVNPHFSHNNYYLYFGRLSSEKGILTLLKAWLQIKEIKLKIVGAGKLENTVKEFVAKNSIKNVEVIGFKEGVALENLIKNAKFTILPSEWYENNPMSILESFAFGTPVLAADIGGIPELVKEGETGFLFESRNHNSIIQSVKKAESLSLPQYNNISQTAYEFVKQNFNQEVFYNRLSELYNQLLENRT